MVDRIYLNKSELDVKVFFQKGHVKGHQPPNFGQYAIAADGN